MTQPIREVETRHQCRCLLIEGGVENRCDQIVDSPDVPFCDICDDRHVNRFGPNIIVTVWTD